MNLKEGFMGGFLVLGFIIFIVGFMSGILAVALGTITPDFTVSGFMIFTLGFITGIVTIALVLITLKLTELPRKSP